MNNCNESQARVLQFRTEGVSEITSSQNLIKKRDQSWKKVFLTF